MKFSILLLPVIMHFSVLSQETLTVLDPGVKKVSQFYQSLSFINKIAETKQFLVALAEENNVHFYMFDDTWKNLSQFKENREWVADQSVYQNYKQYMSKSNIFFSQDFQPIGSINNGDKQFIIAFLRNHKLYFQQVDFNAGKSKNLDLWESPNKEKILHTFSFRNKLYWITHRKKSDDVIDLNRYNADGRIESNKISIDQLRTASQIFRPGSSTIGSDFIENDRQTDLLKASARIKFYTQNNSLFIVSDEFQGKTKIAEVNLDNFEERNHSIEHKPAGSCRLISSQNSFLLNNYLFQVSVCEGTFTFTIHNLSDKKQTSYSFKKDQEIDFKNTEVMQYGKSLFTPDEKKLSKTSQFIRKVDGGGLGVLATLVDSNLEVTMGSSQIIQTRGGSMYMPGGSVGPGGTVHLPGHWVTTGYYESYTKTILFKSLFNKTELQHVNSSLPLEDKTKAIDEFYDKKDHFALPPLIDGKSVIVGSLDRETKKFKIIRL